MIYVDMDGVVADFSGFYNQHPKWNDSAFLEFVHKRGFENLPRLHGANLVKCLSYKFGFNQFTFLSSCGGLGINDADNVALQKRFWLDTNGFSDIKLICVKHKGLKKHFASHDNFLIDDTKQNIWDFKERHGSAVLVKDSSVGLSVEEFGVVEEFLHARTDKTVLYTGE